MTAPRLCPTFSSNSPHFYNTSIPTLLCPSVACQRLGLKMVPCCGHIRSKKGLRKGVGLSLNSLHGAALSHSLLEAPCVSFMGWEACWGWGGLSCGQDFMILWWECGPLGCLSLTLSSLCEVTPENCYFIKMR